MHATYLHVAFAICDLRYLRPSLYATFAICDYACMRHTLANEDRTRHSHIHNIRNHIGSSSTFSFPFFVTSRSAAMLCSSCNEFRPRGKKPYHNWSDSQWVSCTAVLMTSRGDNVDMNCCKICSPTFFKSGRALSPESTAGGPIPSSSSCHNNGSETDIDIVFAAEVTVAEATRAKQFLVRMIPVAFWDLLHDRLTWYGHENVAIKAHWQAAGEKSPIKWLSRHGAIKVRQSMPRNLICWTDPQTHVAYFDATNKHYCAIFDELWPRCFSNISNYGVKGDLMEAFLGYGFLAVMERAGMHFLA
jgi:hypothetical protein